MIKLNFINPIIRLNGKETIMSIRCAIFINKIIYKEKIFVKKVTLKNNDKYDLNKAKNILQALLEQKAYLLG